MASATCPDCDVALAGNWCADCGQRAPRPDDLSARRFFGLFWEETTSLDSRTWRTLRAFFTPGELTRAAFAHQRQRYLPPLRLYLIVSGVFFLLAWGVYYDAIAAAVQLNPAGQPPGIVALLSDPVAAGRIADYTAWFRFGAVLLFGLGVALLFWRRRLPLGAHLIFAAHYYCADFLLFSLFAIPMAFAPAAQLVVYWSLTTSIGMVVLLIYLILALRRAYAIGWLGAILRGLGLMLLDLLLSSLANQLAIFVVMRTQ